LVLHDYECAAHGKYEAFEPKCPYGCSKAFQKVVFLKPVGTRSARTRFQDRETRALAESFGMTNVKSHHDGESVMQTMRRTGNYSDAAAARWVKDIPHSDPGWSWNKPFAEAQAQAQRFNLNDPRAKPVTVSGALPPPKPNFITVQPK